jgi:hypothetical protein
VAQAEQSCESVYFAARADGRLSREWRSALCCELAVGAPPPHAESAGEKKEPPDVAKVPRVVMRAIDVRVSESEYQRVSEKRCAHCAETSEMSAETTETSAETTGTSA